MWELNYEDRNKFHISVGAGMMIAAVLLYITTIWNFYNALADFEYPKFDENDVTGRTKEELKQVGDTILKILGDRYEQSLKLAKYALIGGTIIFFLGYIPWIYLSFKKKK